MTSPDRGYSIPEIVYPEVITPIDTNKILSFQKEGKSLAASVALVIIDEGNQIASEEYDQVDFPDNARASMVSVLMDRRRTQLALQYVAPGMILLESEQVLRGGESITEEMIAQFRGEKVRLWEMKEIWPAIAVREVGWELLRQQYANILKTHGPLALINYYVGNKIGRKINPLMDNARDTALEAGQRRFVQLYLTGGETAQ